MIRGHKRFGRKHDVHRHVAKLSRVATENNHKVSLHRHENLDVLANRTKCGCGQALDASPALSVATAVDRRECSKFCSTDKSFIMLAGHT